MTDDYVRELQEYEVRADNTVEALIMPWNTPTDITEAVAGRLISYREQFARGAFERAEKAPHRTTLNWGHSDDFHNAIGKGRVFHNTDAGEIGVFKLNDSDASRARELIADMGLSISFRSLAPQYGTEQHGSIVTRRAVLLNHVAVVRSPAYPDPRILAMREADEAKRAAERALEASNAALRAALVALADQGRELTEEQRVWITARGA